MATHYTGTLNVRIQIDPSADLLALYARLNELLEEPEYLRRLLKLAVSRTFLRAYRARFLAGLPEALHMRRVGVSSTARQATKDALRMLSDAHDALSDAHALEDHEAAKAASERVARATANVAGMLRGESITKNTLNELVTRAFQVMTLLTTADALGVMPAEGGGLTIGIGDLTRLNEIETPTANKSGFTDSAMTILWRHLEFGTGIYATDPEGNPRKTFKEADGTWWWGRKKRQGLHVEGSRPIGALRLGNDLANSPEAMEFDQVVTELLRAALAI